MNEGENIRKELENIAPEIQWKREFPDFSIPEGYFGQATREIWDKIQVEEGEKALSKTLPYQVPDGYFDQLPQKVLEKVQDTPRIISLPRQRRRRYDWAMAAAIAAIVALAGLLSQPNRPAGTHHSLDLQLATISNNAIEQYLDNHLSSLNTEDLYEYLNPQDQQDPMIHDVSSQAIEEYLNNNVDTSDNF